MFWCAATRFFLQWIFIMRLFWHKSLDSNGAKTSKEKHRSACVFQPLLNGTLFWAEIQTEEKRRCFTAPFPLNEYISKSKYSSISTFFSTRHLLENNLRTTRNFKARISTEKSSWKYCDIIIISNCFVVLWIMMVLGACFSLCGEFHFDEFELDTLFCVFWAYFSPIVSLSSFWTVYKQQWQRKHWKWIEYQ